LSEQRAGSASRRGQALTEFAILYAGVILPLTFMTIFWMRRIG
jgi:hypothetical protein